MSNNYSKDKYYLYQKYKNKYSNMKNNIQSNKKKFISENLKNIKLYNNKNLKLKSNNNKTLIKQNENLFSKEIRNNRMNQRNLKNKKINNFTKKKKFPNIFLPKNNFNQLNYDNQSTSKFIPNNNLNHETSNKLTSKSGYIKDKAELYKLKKKTNPDKIKKNEIRLENRRQKILNNKNPSIRKQQLRDFFKNILFLKPKRKKYKKKMKILNFSF